MTWRIVYMDGKEELTPENVDQVTTGICAPSEFLYAYATRTYGANELIRTYPCVNIRYWEKIR